MITITKGIFIRKKYIAKEGVKGVFRKMRVLLKNETKFLYRGGVSN